MKEQTFEEFLQDKHGKDYVGTDDNMPDSFNQWLTDMPIDTCINFAEEWHLSLKNPICKSCGRTFIHKDGCSEIGK